MKSSEIVTRNHTHKSEYSTESPFVGEMKIVCIHIGEENEPNLRNHNKEIIIYTSLKKSPCKKALCNSIWCNSQQP